MRIAENHQSTPNKSQTIDRFVGLRNWMYQNNITFTAIGRTMGVTSAAANASLSNARMPVRHHRAIVAAWPDLPVELLPEPRDVPLGPKPKGLQIEEVEHDFLPGNSQPGDQNDRIELPAGLPGQTAAAGQ